MAQGKIRVRLKSYDSTIIDAAAANKTDKERNTPISRLNSWFARLNIGHTPRKFPTSMGSHLPLHRISSSYIIH